MFRLIWSDPDLLIDYFKLDVDFIIYIGLGFDVPWARFIYLVFLITLI